MFAVVSLILCMALPAEGPASGARADTLPVFTTDARAYSPGQRVGVHLRNRTSVQVAANLCFINLTLERRHEDQWKSVRANLFRGEMRVCFDDLPIAFPGQELTGEVFLPEDLPPGTYRLRTTAEVGGSHTLIYTTAFRVRRSLAS